MKKDLNYIISALQADLINIHKRKEWNLSLTSPNKTVKLVEAHAKLKDCINFLTICKEP